MPENPLIETLSDLFAWPAKSGEVVDAGNASASIPIVQNGQSKTMVILFKRATDWTGVAALYAALQTSMDFPEMPVEVTGSGFRLYLPLQEPLPVSDLQAFLHYICLQYLSDIPGRLLGFGPKIDVADSDTIDLIHPIPALDERTGRWSAFIDPSMGGMFIDEPWLDIAPNPDKQAEMLSVIKPVAADVFYRALAWLRDAVTPAEARENSPDAAGLNRGCLSVSGSFSDPRLFLLAVMNDPLASPILRVDAAKALLPFVSPNTPDRPHQA